MNKRFEIYLSTDIREGSNVVMGEDAQYYECDTNAELIKLLIDLIENHGSGIYESRIYDNNFKFTGERKRRRGQ